MVSKTKIKGSNKKSSKKPSGKSIGSKDMPEPITDDLKNKIISQIEKRDDWIHTLNTEDDEEFSNSYEIINQGGKTIVISRFFDEMDNQRDFYVWDKGKLRDVNDKEDEEFREIDDDNGFEASQHLISRDVDDSINRAVGGDIKAKDIVSVDIKSDDVISEDTKTELKDSVDWDKLAKEEPKKGTATIRLAKVGDVDSDGEYDEIDDEAFEFELTDQDDNLFINHINKDQKIGNWERTGNAFSMEYKDRESILKARKRMDDLVKSYDDEFTAIIEWQYWIDD